MGLTLPFFTQAQTLNISTFAGNGTGTNSGDNGLATSAGVSNPAGICFDKKGNAYIATTLGRTVRKVDTFGVISTYAGTGNNGFSGDSGLAINADLSSINAVVADKKGNIYISDAGNHRIRKVDTFGIITTVVGNGTGGYGGDNGPAAQASIYTPQGISIDKAGNRMKNSNECFFLNKSF